MGGPGQPAELLIGPDTTVRDAVMRYPGIEAVFERHGMGGCGGANGPVEPIGFFARVHQVDPPQLLRELNAYAAGRTTADSVPLMVKRPARKLETYVLGVGAALVLTLLAGLPMGILAAVGGPRDIGLGTRWTPLVQAHGHLQLMGWVGLFIVGMACYVLPRFKQTDLRYPHLARPAIGLIAAGVALRTVTQPYSDHGWVSGLMVASAVVEMAGVACFVAVVTGTLLASRRKNYDWYLLAACGWLAASAAANLVVVAEIAIDNQSVIASAKDGPLLTMQLYGFIALFIFGVSLRILPHFLSLRPPSVRWFVPALVLYNAGLLLRVVSGWASAYSSWTRPDGLEALGVYAMAAGVVAFALALKLHLPARRDEEGEVERGHVKIIRTAYAWLVVAVVIEIWVATRALGTWTPDFLQAGAARHAMALGFATGMLMGVGSRTLPTFAGRTLHSRLLLDISFWMLNIAAFTRVGSGVFAVGAVSSRFDHIAGSGGLTFLALGLFAYNIGRSVLGGPAPPTREAVAVMVEVDTGATPAFTPGADTVVAEVLEKIPASLELLLSYGLKPLADPAMRAKVAPTVSLGMVCKMHDINLATLLADLKQLQAGSSDPAQAPVVEHG